MLEKSQNVLFARFNNDDHRFLKINFRNGIGSVIHFLSVNSFQILNFKETRTKKPNSLGNS